MSHPFLLKDYFFTPGLLSYPAVKIAVKNAKLTPRMIKNPINMYPLTKLFTRTIESITMYSIHLETSFIIT